MLTESQKKSILNHINTEEKKILDIQAKAKKDIESCEKRISDLRRKLALGS